ncbi:MAG: hypothetical protein SVU88_01535 [Candidatus Nanohaloarchaea archaeon]|nr:hypothetical protein [Candidatus Nanohaloarchaea archaeon]
MDWTRVGNGEWQLADPDFDGTAALQETNQGYVAAISVTETQFDMELLDEREFFETRDAALEFLQEKMAQDSY